MFTLNFWGLGSVQVASPIKPELDAIWDFCGADSEHPRGLRISDHMCGRMLSECFGLEYELRYTSLDSEAEVSVFIVGDQALLVSNGYEGQHIMVASWPLVDDDGKEIYVRPNPVAQEI